MRAMKLPDLVILGDGVHGREMVHIVERINRVTPTWNLIGHLGADAIHAHPTARLIADNEFPKDIVIPRDRIVSLIDPSAFVHPTARIGAGCVIYPNCFIGCGASLGERVFMLAGAVINHDDVLEDRVTVCTNVSLAGYVHVEADCYLGQACTVRQRLRIGRGSLLGMGCVVVSNVPPESVMVGNPARLLRKNSRRA